MTFTFGARSLKTLEGVHRDLRLLCNEALSLSSMDFTITEGLRTKHRQRQLVQDGKSQTMNSKHLTGHAIDFAPYRDRRARLAWPFFYPVADAFIQASRGLRIPIIWGGAWGVDLLACKNAQDAQERYIMSKTDGRWFFDGPHIELVNTDDEPQAA